MSKSLDLTVSDDFRSSIQSSSLSVLEAAQSLQITSNEERLAAAEFLTTVIRPLLIQIDKAYDPNIKRWYEGHKQAIADKKKISRDVLLAKTAIDGIIGRYDLEQRQKKLDEQRRLAQAIQSEVQRSTVAEAQKLVESGEEDKAMELLETLPAVVERAGNALPQMIHKTAKAEGVSTRFLPRFRMVDEKKLKPEYTMPDESKIQDTVNRLGKGAEIEVGEGAIEYYEKPSIASSAR